MSIKTHIPDYMRPATGNKDVIEVDGNTVGECLSHLVTLIPRIKEELFYSGTGESLTTSGMLWSKIKVLVNGESIDSEGLAKK